MATAIVQADDQKLCVYHFTSQIRMLCNASQGSWDQIAFVASGNQVDELSKIHSFKPEDVMQLRRGWAEQPTYVFTGTGVDLPLMEWLNKYTFPTEAKFSDEIYARHVYERTVAHLIRNGTTTACYFGSIHGNSTVILADIVAHLGQRALVGKVCMDRNSPDYYIETTDDSLRDTEDFIQRVLATGSSLVRPIITPRFVPTCSSELMAGLGALAAKYDVHIQSHLSENKSEIAFVRELHPDETSYTHVYDVHGLLTAKTVMAHCIHLGSDEITLLHDRGTAVIHCPNSNFSGVLNVRALQTAGVKIGLGTDVSGGYSHSMLDAIRQALIASKVAHIIDKSDPLDVFEGLYLATLGSAAALSMEHDIGNFVVGKYFDALLVDADVPDSPVGVFDVDTTEDIISKFILLGDDRNIKEVIVAGNVISSR